MLLAKCTIDERYSREMKGLAGQFEQMKSYTDNPSITVLISSLQRNFDNLGTVVANFASEMQTEGLCRLAEFSATMGVQLNSLKQTYKPTWEPLQAKRNALTESREDYLEMKKSAELKRIRGEELSSDFQKQLSWKHATMNLKLGDLNEEISYSNDHYVGRAESRKACCWTTTGSVRAGMKCSKTLL